MKIIVGLGNPEQKYFSTRHNVGWQFLDYYAKEESFPAFQEQKKFHSMITRKDDVWLVKPLTYMNESGLAVGSFLQFYQPDLLNGQEVELNSLAVVHDDLDIALGSWKLQYATGPKVHNGVNSIRDHLHTDQFWYGRIGIDGRGGDRVQSGKDYVLQPFLLAERESLQLVFKNLHIGLQEQL